MNWLEELEKEEQKIQKQVRLLEKRRQPWMDLENRLGQELLQVLSESSEDRDRLETLEKQARLLDKAFTQLVSKAGSGHGQIEHYGLAFRAQSQYRHTDGVIGALKKEKEENDGGS